MLGNFPRTRVIAKASIVALGALLAACDRPPTEPSVAPRPRPALASASSDVAAIDLGTLPGDAWSVAQFVDESGVVYGQSCSLPATCRNFRWTPTDGIQLFTGTIPGRGGGNINAKGERAETICPDGGSECEGASRAARVFVGGLAQDLGTEPVESESPRSARGLLINRWGHVAVLTEYSFFGTHQTSLALWTPRTGYRHVAPAELQIEPWTVLEVLLLNDNDQVVANEFFVLESRPVVWRADLGAPVPLRSPTHDPNAEHEFPESFVLDQNNRRELVGSAFVETPGGRAEHAVLWAVPPLDRTDWPVVDANPYGGSGSRISLSSPGAGRYYQLYQATQAAAGPYVELVDWGDGTTSRRTRPRVGILTSQNHLYAAPGTYWVRVYVTDAQGRWGVDERKVTIVP